MDATFMDVLLTRVSVLCRAVLAVRHLLLFRALAAVLLDWWDGPLLGLLLLTAVAGVRAAAVGGAGLGVLCLQGATACMP
jgi:hypothetical protein